MNGHPEKPLPPETSKYPILENLLTGRGKTLDHLQTYLDTFDDDFLIIFLTGQPGIGKTAIRRQLRDYLAKLPDNQGQQRFEISTHTFDPVREYVMLQFDDPDEQAVWVKIEDYLTSQIIQNYTYAYPIPKITIAEIPALAPRFGNATKRRSLGAGVLQRAGFETRINSLVMAVTADDQIMSRAKKQRAGQDPLFLIRTLSSLVEQSEDLNELNHLKKIALEEMAKMAQPDHIERINQEMGDHLQHFVITRDPTWLKQQMEELDLGSFSSQEEELRVKTEVLFKQTHFAQMGFSHNQILTAVNRYNDRLIVTPQ